MSHHPARRARRATAVVSATAFAGLAGGFALTHAGAAATANHTSPPTTAPAGQYSSGGQDGSGQDDSGVQGPGQVDQGSQNGFPTGPGWSADPGDPGQDGGQGAVDQHGQSGAS